MEQLELQSCSDSKKETFTMRKYLGILLLLLIFPGRTMRANDFQFITIDSITYFQWNPGYDLFGTSPYAGLWTEPHFNLDRTYPFGFNQYNFLWFETAQRAQPMFMVENLTWNTPAGPQAFTYAFSDETQRMLYMALPTRFTFYSPTFVDYQVSAYDFSGNFVEKSGDNHFWLTENTPEPGSLLFMLTGLVGVGITGLRRKTCRS